MYKIKKPTNKKKIALTVTEQQYKAVVASVEAGEYLSISDYIRNALQKEIERKKIME
ncbi:MAG: RuvA C-terminal domain-containing protein [archaeon]|nr:RuvA C-terminal domain-containing protein [archaeon]